MRMIRATLAGAMMMASSGLWADTVEDVMQTAHQVFDRMPRLAYVDHIAGRCGADLSVNDRVVYCTTLNLVFVDRATAAQPEIPYLVAHALGHAVQVQHGVADVALREILSRPDEETALRTMVESQVDCIAGFLYARAGLAPASLTDWFAAPPLAGPHWGRDPLRLGPQVLVDLPTRQTWFQTGQGADSLAACAVGEFAADLLLLAYQGESVPL